MLIVAKSVGIFLASLLVIYLVMMFTGGQQRATGLGYLRAQSSMLFIVGLLYLTLGIFLRESPLLK
jgi:hypothetical protein